jgi:hypothetical protein
MNLLELQQRANILVDKVNQYEASLTGTELDENQVLNQHTYADIFCLRPVLKLLFGKDVSDKLSRTLENDIELPLVSSTAPAWNTFFNFFNQEVTSNQHEFIQNIDTYNSSNMLMLDTQQYTLTDRDTAISLGIRYSYGANIGDALVTESQVSNLFNWNTTNDTTVRNNTQTTNRQVPGIVLYYLGNDYNGVYTATIPYSRVLSNINTVNDNNPPLYGAYYDSSDVTKSQVGLDMGAECCRIFIPGCNYLGGKLISPQQIWQPDRKVGDDNIGYGYNWQGNAVYHELVFKNRRSGCSNNGVDFIPGLDTIPDNDVQGLATRAVLAQMKNYYYNRPWFNELNSLYGVDTSKLVNSIKNAATTEATKFYSFNLNGYQQLVNGRTDDNTGVLSNSTGLYTINNTNTEEQAENSIIINLNSFTNMHYIFKYKKNTTSDCDLTALGNILSLYVGEGGEFHLSNNGSWFTSTNVKATNDKWVILDINVTKQSGSTYNFVVKSIIDTVTTEIYNTTTEIPSFPIKLILGSFFRPGTLNIDLPNSSIAIDDNPEVPIASLVTTANLPIETYNVTINEDNTITDYGTNGLVYNHFQTTENTKRIIKSYFTLVEYDDTIHSQTITSTDTFNCFITQATGKLGISNNSADYVVYPTAVTFSPGDTIDSTVEVEHGKLKWTIVHNKIHVYVLSYDTTDLYNFTNTYFNCRSDGATKTKAIIDLSKTSIVQQANNMTMNDTQFYNSYQLNYDTFADAFGFSK